MKKTLNRILAAVLAIMMLLGASLAFAETAPVEVITFDASEVLVTVNGQPVTFGDTEFYTTYLINAYVDNYGVDASDPELINFCRQQGLNFAIQYALLDQAGVELNVALSEEEKAQIEAAALTEWKTIVDNFCAGQYGISEASTEEEKNAALVGTLATLESAYDYTESSFVQEAVDNALREKIEAAICKDVQVSEEDIKARYDELVAADREQYSGDDGVYIYEYMQVYGSYYGVDTFYYIPEGYRSVDQILLKVDQELLDTYTTLSARFEEQNTEPEEGQETETTEAPVTAEQVEEARQAILASIQPTVDEINEKYSNGTSFEDLILEYNTDPGMADEATRKEGYHVHADSIMWEPPFVAAAMSLEKIGDVSEPAIGSRGVHIVHYLKDVGGAVEMTPEAHNAIMEELLAPKENEALNAYIEARIATSDIQYTESGNVILAFEIAETEEAE